MSSSEWDHLVAMNGQCPPSVEALYQDHFAQQVEARPAAISIFSPSHSITYAELDALSNALANFLVSQGIGPEVVVPLCFEHSPWAIISMLSVVKAGGVFTFLDAASPRSRLQDIVNNIDAKALLISPSLAESSCVAGIFPTSFVISDEFIRNLPAANAPSTTTLDHSNLLYLIFTSGSTGLPKGVCISHSAYLSSALHQRTVCRLGPESRVLQFAKYTFDISILETLTTLISGGCICIPDEDARGRGLEHVMNEFRITWSVMTVSLSRVIEPVEVPSLRTLLLGGEPLTPTDLTRWAGHVQLMNAYGPTEASILAAVNPRVDANTDAANIGWPVGGLLWVVDADDANRLVPAGRTGELAIEGPSLASGYLNDEAKTGAAFVQDLQWMQNFPDDRKRRVYLTGDLVQRSEVDDSIRFVGRKDTQVKVRGFRIELGDIESNVARDGLVHSVAAFAPTSGACQGRLVAVVVLAPACQPSLPRQVSGAHAAATGSAIQVLDPSQRETKDAVLAIQHHLGQRVQGYMIPNTWVVLKTLPLTPHDKIDRAQVKQWLDHLDVEALRSYECLPEAALDQDGDSQPGTQMDGDALALELASDAAKGVHVSTDSMRTMVAQVLNLPLPSVDPAKSFVNLGGDSISAMLFMSRCKSQQLSVKVRDILRCKSISELARCADKLFTAVEDVEIADLVDEPFGLTPIQQYYFQREPEGDSVGGANRFNQSFLLRLNRPCPADIISAAVSAVVQRHSMLRCRFVKSDSGHWQQFILPSSGVSYCHVFQECMASSESEIDKAILRSQCAIHMVDGPVFAVDLINTPHGYQLLSLIAHHAVVDLVSWRVIMQDLEDLIDHGSIQTHREISLPFQAWYKLQYEYSVHQLTPEKTLQCEVPLADFEYWGMEEQPNLFQDTARYVFQLDADTTSTLMSAESHWPLRTDPVDIFLASVIHSLGIVFKDRSIPTVFREAHGREPWSDNIDISSSVGWFTTMYPICVGSPSCTDGFLETIRRVKDAQRSVPKNGWPYFAARFNNARGIDKFGHHRIPEITFDYLGLYQNLERKDSLFRREHRINQDVGPAFNRFSLVEITAEALQGQIQFTFEFNTKMRHQSRLQQWFQECERCLRYSALELPAMTTPKFTMSDFPLLQTNYGALDVLSSTTFPELGIAVDNVDDIYSTSPMQTGLLISQEKDADLYQSSMVFRIRSASESEPIDVQRIEKAWQTVVGRHSCLRTVFLPDNIVSVRDDAFNQVVLKTVTASIVRVQASSVNELSEVLTAPLHLSPRGTQPAHRCTICVANTGEIYVRLDINHALFDASSTNVLVRDLLMAYTGLATSKAPLYRDFIAHVQSCDLEKSLEYWNGYLAGVQASCLPVLIDGTRIASDAYQTVRIDHEISIKGLTKFCQQQGVTPPTLIKAAWAMVLGSYVGSENVCFGYVVSGRDLPIDNIDQAVGVFINILVCRVDLDGSLGTVLDGIHADTQTALQHQNCSLAHVQRQSGQLKSAVSSTALFNTVVNYQVQKQHISEQVRGSPITAEMTYCKDPNEFAVCVDAVSTGDSLEMSLMYRTSALSLGQAKNMALALKAACNSIVSTAAEGLTMKTSSLNFLDPVQESQLWSWNNTVPAPVLMRIDDAITRRASLFPDALAVDSWDGSVTYDQLDDMSNKLCSHIVHLGVKLGSKVILCFEKSLYPIVALMAVLKAGGIFILLDPHHISMERTRGLILDTQADLLLSDQRGAQLLAKEVRTVFIVDDRTFQSLSEEPCCRESIGKRHSFKQRLASPTDPAYIIFTSGTTGKPKGIVTSHAAFCTAAFNYGPKSRLSTNTRALQWSSYTFDACLIEMLSCLMFGGCVCVPSEHQRRDDLVAAIRDFRVNWLGLTPSVSRILEPQDVAGPLETLWLMGEAMSKSDVRRWKDHVHLLNAYGPSECSATVAWHDQVTEEDPTNLGHPVGALCWIVHPNDSDRLMPIGTMGELLIEGFTLADGYLNNRDKTAEAFIKPPKWLVGRRAANQLTACLYKTGDICRYNSDGTICFLGRKDNQVKLNGQRIEPSEIEHHLLTRSSRYINGVTVEVIKLAARQDRQTLVAFFTCAVQRPATPSLTETSSGLMLLDLTEDMIEHLLSLQDTVSDTLPPFMIPTVFIPLAAFPRAPSGKLDRKTLRSTAQELPSNKLDAYGLLTRSKKPPASEMEKKLQAAWAAALDISPSNIDGDSNFFRVGGDSLSAIRLVSLARKKFGLSLSVAHILKHPRLCDLANTAEELDHVLAGDTAFVQPFSNLAKDRDDESIQEIIRGVAEQCGVPKGNVVDIYPCSPLQEATVAATMIRPGAYVHQHVLRLSDSNEEARFIRAWEQVTQHNPILRTRIVNSEICGTVQAVLNEPTTWESPMRSLKEYLADDIALPFHWGEPLSRYAIIRAQDPDGHRCTHIVWTAHHALYDGWSQRLIFEQLEHAYLGDPLPELIPYSHYIQFLGSTRSDDAACAAFWAKQLSGHPATTIPLPMSTIHSLRPNRNVVRDFVLNATTGANAASGSLASPQIRMTTIIRAAWALVTARYANSDDIVFGTTLSGRNAPVPNIARVNGPTIVTVPIKIHVDRMQPVSDFLQSIQNQADSMIPFEHWGLRNIGKVGSPLNSEFQNLLVIQPGQFSQPKLPIGLEMVDLEPEEDFHTYPLIVECFLVDKDRVQLKMAYDGQVVPYGPRLASHFEHLCHQLAARATDDAVIGNLDFCTAEDKAKIFEWNHEDPTIVHDTIHDRFSTNARIRPDAPAVQCWDDSFSYHRLDELSSTLARHLVGIGLSTETVIPVVFEKSAWAVVAQLAVLKAGGVLCMLDPAHPIQRLQHIVDTVDAKVILTSETHANLLRSERGPVIVKVNSLSINHIRQVLTESSGFSIPKTKYLLPTVSSSHAAYIVFTSGTTGKPKGSVTEHGAYTTASASLVTSTRISSSSRMLQYAAYAFDAYIFETFTPLMEGGCVCIPQDAARTNPTALRDTIREYGATHALLTPSVARLLIKDSVPSIQTLILGGEAMAPSDRTWSDRVHLVNAYGPSESSVCSVIQENVTLDTEHLAIGKMVSGRGWIVEPQNHHLLAPVGCVGELLLESPALARGYLKEPIKTSEVFVESPAWLTGIRPHSRLYKTGDLVKYNTRNGTLLFVGRKDLQVKIHGQRLELAEIEHHIAAVSDVESVLVTIPGAGYWKGKLVATLSLNHSGSSIPAETQTGNIDLMLLDPPNQAKASKQLQEIKNHLEREVPSYMIPTAWAVVQGIPLTLSRKIDKHKITSWLEALDDNSSRRIMDIGSSFEDSEPKREPTLDMEKRLQEIISRVLNIPVQDVFLNRSFIALGGDSIASMEAMARCGSENISVTVKDILQSKTITQLARRAVDLGKEGSLSQRSKFEEESEGTFFPLTPIQKLYFEAGLGRECDTSYHVSSGSAHFNQSFFLELQHPMPIEKVAGALRAVIGQHSMLRARFDTVNGGWNQLIEPKKSPTCASWELEYHQLQSELDMLPIIATSQRRISARSGIVFSANLFSILDRNQNHQRQLLFLVAHHLVVDLVSWRIILQDFEELLKSGHLFTQQPISFQTWAKEEHKYANKELVPNRILPKVPMGSSLLLSSFDMEDFWGVKKSNLFGDAAISTFMLSVDTTTALLERCNDCFATEPSDLFIAGLLASFASVFNDRAVPTVHCEGHGREPWDGSGFDLSGTVGWFTTIYPIHVQLDRDQCSLKESIRRVKDARRRVSARDGWSYFTSRLLSASTDEPRDLSSMELLFNYKGLYQQLERADALLREIPLPGPTPAMNGPLISETSDVGPQCPRMAVFDVSVQISEGRALFALIYNQNMHHVSRVRQWMSSYEEVLKTIALEFSAVSTREPTLADFPLLPSLNYQALDKLSTETLPALGLTSFDQISDLFPCAPTQKGILISQHRVPGSYRTSVVFAVSHEGSTPPELNRLIMAWGKVVARHSALRTIFIESDEDGYSQLVLREWVPRVVHFECGPSDKDDEILERMNNLPVATYDHSTPSHLTTFCQTMQRIYVKLEISHTLIDGSSLGILLQDLALAYEDKLSLDESDLPLYRDYVDYIQSLPKEVSIDYWDHYLSNARPCHFPNLRDDHDQAAKSNDTSSVASIDISFDVDAKSIREFCRAHGLTHASLFQVAWALVLRVYVGSSSSSIDSSICFGYLSSGRDVPVKHIGEIIGAVCNMLVFKMDLNDQSRELSLLELVQRAQDDWTASLQHQFMPLADIQHRHEGQRLFNTSMSYRSQERTKSPSGEDLAASPLSIDLISGYDPSEFDVVINIVAGPSGFGASFNYSPSCMTSLQAENAAFAFNIAVKKIIENGSLMLKDFILMADEDLARAPATPPHDIPALEDRLCDMVISQTAQRQPSVQAISSWDGTLTYQELDTLSSHLAVYLVSLGIGPGCLVPVCMEKSLWAIVVFLSIMKAGGAFAPMDATQPGRWQTILEQTGANITIASEERKGDMAALCNTVVVVNQQTLEQLVQQKKGSISSAIQPQHKRSTADPAYIIFTSGSTGTPKGVVVSHSAWCSSALGLQRAWRVDAQTRFLQFASYGFDATIGETLMVLMAGGCVCSPSETERLDDFEGLIKRMAVNAAFLVPSFARTLNPENIHGLQTVIMGGESVLEEDITRWGNRLRLLTGYGPTECSVVCSGMQLRPGVTRSGVIGYPYMCRYWVVDPNDHQVLLPLGAVGELLIEGPVLAREYLNNPGKTAEAFVENPSWATKIPNKTRRFYKAGDLVQLNLDDGSYRCRGRIDAQVKVNGQRIELHEVEVHLERALASNHHVAVETLSNQENHEVRLVAFVALGDKFTNDGQADLQGRYAPGICVSAAAKDEFKVILAGVRDRMEKTAPSYMIPSIFISVTAIPLLASGKTDRRQLRQMAASVPASERNLLSEAATSSISKPSRALRSSAHHLSHVEARMCQHWASVLGVDVTSIRPDLSFFAQGGDSILAIKLASICRADGLSVSVSQILRNPTVEAMCKLLGPESVKVASGPEKNRSEKQVDEPVTSLSLSDTAKFVKNVVYPQVQISPNKVVDIVQATSTQASFVTTGLLEGRGNTNYMLFELIGHIDQAKIEMACRQLVARHPILRTVFVAHQRYLWQVVLDNLDLEFTTHRCAKWRQGHLARRLIKSDQAKPVRLGQTYVRFEYLNGGKSGSLLIMRISHAQYDGMSIPVLFEDLCALYEDLGNDSDAQILRPAFVDFARASHDSNARGAKDYWRHLLEGSQMTNIVAHRTPPHHRCRVTTLAREVSVADMKDFTFANIAKASWALVLNEAAMSNDVVFGHLISGRNICLPNDKGDINEVLGPCINMVPIRVRVDASNPHDILRQVYDQQLGCIPYETFGLDQIVEHCTKWPLWTRFSSIVQHQNLDGVEELMASDAGFRFGNASCRFGAVQGEPDMFDILVMTRPLTDHEVQPEPLRRNRIGVKFLFNEKVVMPDLVAHLMDRFIANIEFLTTSDHQGTETWSIPPKLQPVIPVLPRNYIDQEKPIDHMNAALGRGLKFGEIKPVIQRLVRNAWHSVALLPGAESESESGSNPTATAFYDIWGSLIAAAQLADFYNRQGGFKVSMEEMIEYPSMLAQGWLLAAKMGMGSSPGKWLLPSGRRKTKVAAGQR